MSQSETQFELIQSDLFLCFKKVFKKISKTFIFFYFK